MSPPVRILVVAHRTAYTGREHEAGLQPPALLNSGVSPPLCRGFPRMAGAAASRYGEVDMHPSGELR